MWTVGAPGFIHGSPVVTNNAVVSLAGSFGNEEVFALDRETGSLLWSNELITSDGYPIQGAGDVLVSDGIVVVTGNNGVMAFDVETGDSCWTTPYWSILSGAAAADGKVFVKNGASNRMAARDIRTGDIVWESDVEMGFGTPAVAAGTVYFGSKDGSFYAVGARTGETKWSLEMGDFSRSRPIVAGGVIYAAGRDGFLYAIDASTGSEVWRFEIGPAEYRHTTPLVVAGFIYIGSDTGFYAIY
jgi:outer membrane protein assembly factor BamB